MIFICIFAYIKNSFLFIIESYSIVRMDSQGIYLFAWVFRLFSVFGDYE